MQITGNENEQAKSVFIADDDSKLNIIVRFYIYWI